MSLSSMPKDVLAQITSFLRTRDIELLARTYNTIVTPTCLSVLTDWRSTSRNERVMVALFGALVSTAQDEICEFSFGMRDDLGDFSAPTEEPLVRLRALEYLNLRGNLHWLEVMDPDTQEEVVETSNNVSHPSAMAENINNLMRACNRLGIVLPKSTAAFITDPTLRKRLVPANSSYAIELDMSNPLLIVTSATTVTLPNGTEGSIDGYACLVCRSSGSEGSRIYWYLYLHRDGGHCILTSAQNLIHSHDGDDSDNEDHSETNSDYADCQLLREQRELSEACTAAEKDAGIRAACNVDDFELSLFATSFEEFLVRTYFTEWADWLINNEEVEKIPNNLKEYLVHVYTKAGRDSA